MSRPLRLHVPGGCYHVTSRGNHREPLFACTADRRVLNDILVEAIDELEARVHAFCWMTNHLHLLIQIADRPLGALMMRVAQRYSRYRHKALQTTGHLFERRHGAELVDVDNYFLAVLRYIHLNPVKAQLAGDPAEYPWTSHRAYLGVQSIPWLTTSLGLSLFATDTAAAVAAYRDFVRRGDPDEDRPAPAGQVERKDRRVLGDDDFLARLPAPAVSRTSAMSLEALAEEVCETHGIGVEALRAPTTVRPLAAAREEFAALAIERGVANLTELARFLGRDPSTVCKLLGRRRKKFKKAKSGTCNGS